MTDEKQGTINHIGVIIDGNRRYAKARGMPTFMGHEKGAEKVEAFLKWVKELGIKETTIYTLSTENLKRDKTELEHLFRIFKQFFKKFSNSKEIHKDKIKIRFIGDLSLAPKEIGELAKDIEQKTKDYNNYRVNFCFCYGGRLELINAFNKVMKEKMENKNKDKKQEITEESITNSLWVSSEPDFIIRTGGKSRTSNFLPWQSVYSEWFFLDKMWPEIEKQDLIDCMNRFNNVQRNFGK